MLSKTVNNLVSDLKPRQREILVGRFGLDDGEKKTLASLGDKYDITRERVRQIESEALQYIQDELDRKEKTISAISEIINGHLSDFGGARRDDMLVRELKEKLRDNNIHHWHLRFFSEIIGGPFFYPADENFHDFWYLEEKTIKLAGRFISKLENLISNKKEDLIVHGKFDVYLSKAAKEHDLAEQVGSNYVLLSRKFGANSFGDMGLSHWEEINPKTMRGKTYLVLKKTSQPMHFREIAEAINRMGLGENEKEKTAHPQTVHNELIRDPRFVLIGRGIYALKEHGFRPGIAREVIAQTLKENGPLDLPKVIESVLKQRLLKENTIILNLQNKKYFRRLPDGRYHIKA